MDMALGECVAHLNYLTQRGQLVRGEDEQGVHRFRSVDDSLAPRLHPGEHTPDDTPLAV